MAHPALRFPPFPPGEVWLVGAGPGDPGLLTLSALHALETADVVLHDALIDAGVLALARGRLEPVGKRSGRASTPQMRINARLVALARAGQRVVRLKGGDPFVFGRGGEEMLALAAAGVAFRVVPGVSAGVGGAGAAGVPLTHRGVARSIAFVTGQWGPGEAPDWAALGRMDTVVLYMARARMGEIAEAMIAAGRGARTPVLFLADATTAAERTLTATLAEAGAVAATLPPEAALLTVIGEATEVAAPVRRWLRTGPARTAALPSAAEA